MLPKNRDDGDRDAGGECDSGSGGGVGGVGKGDLMSLESLAEDVKSLLVEIFTSGVLFRPTLPGRQQQHQHQHQQSEACEQQETAQGGEQQQRQRRQQQGAFRSGAPPPDPPSSRSKEVDDTAVSTGQDAAAPSAAAEGRTEESKSSCAPAIPPTAGIRAAAVAGGGGGSSSGGSFEGSPVKLLLVGHSLGGCVAVRVAGAAEEVKRRCGGTAEVAGVVAVDVVEGTALAALDDMPEVRDAD